MSIKDDAIDALVALGHRKAEAKRMVGDALARGVQPASVQDLLAAVYHRPSQPQTPASADAVKSRFAAAYYEYLGGMASSADASAGGYSDLLQVARAVGPGLSIEEFEQLGDRVEALNGQRDQLTNAAYQDALWAIPEAFSAERKNPLHFRPVRDAGGKPVDSAFEPMPAKSIEGMSAAEPSPTVPADAVKSLANPAPSAPVTAQEMGALVRGAGSGTVDAMYDGLWRKVQAGEVNEGGQKSALLQAAKMVRDSGGMQSVNDLRALAKDYSQVQRGDDFQRQMRQLVEKHLAKLQSVPRAPSQGALASIMRSSGDGFAPGAGVTSTGKNGNPIAGIIQGKTEAGRFRLDTHEGTLIRGRKQLQSYQPVFSPGDAVHMPRYAADSGGMGTVRAKNPDGTFSVNINGRELRSVRPADMQSPEGLEKTPREQAPAFNFAGAEDPANVGAMLSGLINQQPDEGKTAAGGSSLDKAQAIADAVGVVDQTGVTDLANAGVSLTRAFTEPERAGEHLANAGMRAISAIPVVGDVAKLAKYGTKGAEAARGNSVAHHLLRGGAQAETKAGRKPLFGGGIDTAAQAALQLVGGGSDGGDGGNSSPPASGGAGDAADPRKVGEDAKQAGKDIKSLGESIEKFLNGMGAAGATVVAVGHAVYEKALKPVIDWFKAVDETSKAMLEDNRKLAAFSGELGAAMQKLDSERFLRDVAKSQQMSGGLSRLAGAQSRNEQAQQDLAMPYQRAAVELQALRTELVAYITRMVDKIDFIGDAIEWFLGMEKQNMGPRNAGERAAEMFDEFLADRKL